MKDFKILLVEDEKQMAMFVEMELNHEGYKVNVAYDGRECLNIAEKNEYDLILLDIMIPGLNGIEVCRRIRQSSQMPIIMLTAKSDVSDKVLGLDVGANDYLTKPFAIEELLARIRVYERNKSTSNKADDEIKVKDIVMIAVIQGYANLLDRWGKDDKEALEKSIHAITLETGNMTNLVEKLLFLAKGDSGNQRIEKKEFLVNELVNEVVRESEEGKGTKITVKLDVEKQGNDC